MLDGALLALADQRRTGQDHGDHGEIVDDLHHRSEPARLQIRIELCMRNHLDQSTRQSFPSRHELGHIVDDHVLDVGHPVEGLGNRGCIDVDLNGRLPPGKNIRLELRGNFDDIHEPLRIHPRIDFRRCDLDRRLESGRREAIRDAARQVRTIFVDNADGEVSRLGRGAGGRGVNSEGETIRDKRQHDRVGADAAQFLDRQTVDVCDVQPQPGEPIAPGCPRLARCLPWRLFSCVCHLARQGHLRSPASAERYARQPGSRARTDARTSALNQRSE